MALAHNLGGKKVLIVEDNFLIAEDLWDVMREAGCGLCGTAPTSAAALALLRKELPDGVLLDVGLRDTDASPVAQELVSRGVPFLLVTAYERHQLPEALRGRPCLSKPYSRETLISLASRTFEARSRPNVLAFTPSPANQPKGGSGFAG
jgi:CheY-like chemotaxis protein